MVVVVAAVLFPSSSSRTLALAPARRADHSTLALAVEFRHAERTTAVINAPALVVVVVGATEPVQDEGGVEAVVIVIILEVTSLVGFDYWVRRRRREEEEEGGRRAVAVGCRDVVAGWRGGEGESLRSRGF